MLSLIHTHRHTDTHTHTNTLHTHTHILSLIYLPYIVFCCRFTWIISFLMLKLLPSTSTSVSLTIRQQAPISNFCIPSKSKGQKLQHKEGEGNAINPAEGVLKYTKVTVLCQPTGLSILITVTNFRLCHIKTKCQQTEKKGKKTVPLFITHSVQWLGQQSVSLALIIIINNTQ